MLLFNVPAAGKRCDSPVASSRCLSPNPLHPRSYPSPNPKRGGPPRRSSVSDYWPWLIDWSDDWSAIRRLSCSVYFVYLLLLLLLLLLMLSLLLLLLSSRLLYFSAYRYVVRILLQFLHRYMTLHGSCSVYKSKKMAHRSLSWVKLNWIDDKCLSVKESRKIADIFTRVFFTVCVMNSTDIEYKRRLSQTDNRQTLSKNLKRTKWLCSN